MPRDMKRILLDRIKTKRAKKRADYLNSPKGLAKETAKGMPEAAKKIGRGVKKSVVDFLGGGEYGEKQNERHKRYLEKALKAKGIDEERKKKLEEMLKRYK